MTISSGESLVNDKAGVWEVYSPPRIAPLNTTGNFPPGWSLELIAADPQGRAWDFDDAESRARMKALVEDTQPVLLVGSHMRSWFSSPLHSFSNQSDPAAAKRNLQRAIRHLEFTFELYELQTRQGRYSLHEHPCGASS